MLELTVVIPTLGARPATLSRLLASLEAQTRAPAEIILVVPDDVEFPDLPGTKTVRAARSLPAQRKAGVEAARAALILFADDDMVLAPDFCEALLEVWERRGLSAVAGVTGTITNEPRYPRWREALRAAGGLSHVASRGPGSRMMASGHIRIVLEPKAETEVGFMPGGIMSIRRDLVELDAFDTQFDGYVYGEDLDLSARIRRHGQLVQTPVARAQHLPVDSGLGEGADNTYRRTRQYAYYRAIHRPRGMIGYAAWHWATATEGAIVAARSARRRDPAILRAFLRGLRDTRAALRHPRS